MDNITGPVPQNWDQYISIVGGALEIIPDVLYDTKTYTSASTRTLTFFDTAQTAGRSDITNMQSAGQLPSPQSFKIECPRIFFKTAVQSDDSGAGTAVAITSSFSDVVNLVKSGVVTLTINNKPYGPWPMWMWPCSSFVKGAFATGSDLLADYGQLDGPLYPFDPPLCFLPLQPFSVTLAWPAAAVTLSTGTLDIQVLFDGKRARAIV